MLDLFKLLAMIPDGVELTITRSGPHFYEGAIPVGNFVFKVEFMGNTETFFENDIHLDAPIGLDMKRIATQLQQRIEWVKNPSGKHADVPFQIEAEENHPFSNTKGISVPRGMMSDLKTRDEFFTKKFHLTDYQRQSIITFSFKERDYYYWPK